MTYSYELTEKFRQYLLMATSSPNTLKNYVSDLRLFLFFAEKEYPPVSLELIPRLFTPDVLKAYQDFLLQSYPPATTNRRLSSLKKFIEFANDTHLCPQPLTFSLASSYIPPVVPITPVAYTLPDVVPFITAPVIPPPSIYQPAPEVRIIPNISPVVAEPVTNLRESNLVRMLPDLVEDSLPQNPKRTPKPEKILWSVLIFAFFLSFFLSYFLITSLTNYGYQTISFSSIKLPKINIFNQNASINPGNSLLNPSGE